MNNEHEYCKAAAKVSRRAMCWKTDMLETLVILGFSAWQSHASIILWFKCKNLRINKKGYKHPKCNGIRETRDMCSVNLRE